MHTTIALILSAACLGTPFEDIEQRFRIDLPQGWEFAPLPGDTTGVAFRRSGGNTVAFASVRTFELVQPVDAATVARELAATVQGESGFQLLERGDASLGGMAAARQRYLLHVNGNPELPKMVEDRVAVQHRVVWVLHVETLASAFVSFEPDFAHLFATLKPAAGHAGVATPSPLVGRWLMLPSSNTFLTLGAGGSFDLDGTTGTYSLEGHQLVTRPYGGNAEGFTWRLEGDELVLSSPALEEPIRYRRVSAAPTGPVTWHAVVGRWKGGGHELQLEPSGAVVLDGVRGTYTIERERLLLALASGRLVVRFRLNGNRLTLSGGAFGAARTLERQ